MKKIGYVFSGGGARGFAHLGVIKLLEEIGIKPYAISGSSSGAMVGAFYALGLHPEEILEKLKANISFKFKRSICYMPIYSINLLNTLIIPIFAIQKPLRCQLVQ